MGITDITMVEPQGRQQLAADLGVSAIVDPVDLEVSHPGTRAHVVPRVDVVLECSDTGPP